MFVVSKCVCFCLHDKVCISLYVCVCTYRTRCIFQCVSIINPRHACARVTVVVLCVCALAASASVYTYISATNDTHGFLLGVSWILIRGFSKKSSVQKLWHKKPFSCIFGTNGALQLPEAQLVGRILLQRLATRYTSNRLLQAIIYVRSVRMRSIRTYIRGYCLHLQTNWPHCMA